MNYFILRFFNKSAELYGFFLCNLKTKCKNKDDYSNTKQLGNCTSCAANEVCLYINED